MDPLLSALIRMAWNRSLPMRITNFTYFTEVLYERRRPRWGIPDETQALRNFQQFDLLWGFAAWDNEAVRRQEVAIRCPLCGKPGNALMARSDFQFRGLGIEGLDEPICTTQGTGCLVRLTHGGDGVLGIPAAALQSIFIPHDSIRLHQIVQQDPKFFLRIMSYIGGVWDRNNLETFESYGGIWGDVWISKYILRLQVAQINRDRRLQLKFLSNKLIRLLGHWDCGDCLICGRVGRNFITVENPMRPEWMTSGICNLPDTGCLHKMANLNFSPTEIIAGSIFYILAPWKYTQCLLLACPLLFIKLAEYLAVYDGNLFEVRVNPTLVKEWETAFQELRAKQGDSSGKLKALGTSWHRHYVDTYYLNTPRVPARPKHTPKWPDGYDDQRSVVITEGYMDDTVLVERLSRFNATTGSLVPSETTSSSSSS